MNWAVIMAGGVGERFWPLSRQRRPKQLLPIVGRRTMIQQTVARLRGIVPPQRIVVVTQARQAPWVRRQLPGVRQILAEPVGRNTAPCIGWATAHIRERDPRAVMVVVPADSHIPDTERYRAVVRECLALAGRDDVLVTIGIAPTHPHTGYGYIELGEPLNERFWRAKQFVEKPDRARAEQFVASGRYRWNAGMFVWSARAITAALREFQPELVADARQLRRRYAALPKISIDYAVMEKARNVVVANGDFLWDDVGDWAAVERHQPRDTAGNCVRGEFIGVDATGCVVVNETGKLIAAVGVNDLVIVQTGDATLVCRKADSQRVREVVKQLAAKPKYRKLL